VSASETGLYYDPFDFEIDSDPYRSGTTTRRQTLSYNERDVYALHRFDDVERASVDRKTYGWDNNAVQTRTSTMRGWEPSPS